VVQYFALFVGVYGAQAFFDYMNQIQPGVALTLLVQVWIPKLNNAPKNRVEAKIQVVGLTRVLCDTPALLGDENGKKIWAQTLAGAVTILTSSTFSRGEADGDAEPDMDIGFDSTYARLALATQKVDDPFSNIADPMEMFARSLQTLSSSQPGVLGPIIQHAANEDPKIASGLQSMMQKTGVNLM
jgi:exportin-2 (importin alpha re-exporter)